MKRILRVALLIACSWVQVAWSEDYYWTVANNPAVGKFPSFSAAVNGYVSFSETDTRYWVKTSSSLTGAATGVASFDIYNKETGRVAATQTNLLFQRYGDSCPSNTEYNSETGECTPPEEDKCLPTRGDPTFHRHKLGDILLGTISTTPPPSSVCHADCRYSDPELEGKPYRFVSGDPAGAWATFRYFGDGVTCTDGDRDIDAPSDTRPSTDKEEKCTNKVCLTADESGNCQQYTYSCTATEKHTDPGEMDCDFGEFNGKSVCVPNSPPPKMTEKEVKSDVEVTENSDGSKDTKTTTTTTTTNCTGVGACSTTTTTSVTHNHTNADGTPGAETSTCTGPDCKDSKGKSQNDKKDEEEENKSKVTGDGACDASLSCEADAVQCAILKQQKELRCHAEEQADFEEQQSAIEGAVQGDQFELSEGGSPIDVPSFINEGTRFLPSSCPAAESFSLRSQGGRTFQISYEPLCRAASDLSGLFVAVATVLAALYVGRSVGGQ